MDHAKPGMQAPSAGAAAPPAAATVTRLPEDCYGVHVDNDRDERCLLWLVNQIGEAKLRLSAPKRPKYYPDAPLFVSVLLKRLQLKVPGHVYRAVPVPRPAVYLLVLRDDTVMKIGWSGNWVERALSLFKTADYRRDVTGALLALLDPERRVAVTVADEDAARALEGACLARHQAWRAPSPVERGLIATNCGSTE